MAKKKQKGPSCAVSHLYWTGRNACPRCGGEMTEAKYYTAVHTGSSTVSDHNWSQQTTTRTDYYRDLCLRRGGLCLPCFRKEHRLLRLLRLLEAAGCALLVLLCLIFIGRAEDVSMGFLMGCGIFFGAVAVIIFLSLARRERRLLSGVDASESTPDDDDLSEALVAAMRADPPVSGNCYLFSLENKRRRLGGS